MNATPMKNLELVMVVKLSMTRPKLSKDEAILHPA